MAVVTFPHRTQPDSHKPSSSRQEELCALERENQEKGQPLYMDVQLRSLGEMLWVLLIHQWAGGIVQGDSALGRHARWFVKARERKTPSTQCAPAELTGVDLAGVDLRRVDLQGAVLRDADLSGTDLDSASLLGAELAGTLLLGANLAGAKLVDEQRQDELRQRRMSVLGGPPYAGVELRSRGELLWIMREERWSGEPDPHGWARADLRGVMLNAVDLAAADLTGAQLDGARLVTSQDEARLLAAYNARNPDAESPYKGMTIRTRNELLWLMLKNAWSGDPDPGSLKKANLIGVDLQGARLQCADLEGARLEGAQLQEADLRGTRLRGADLRDVIASRARLKRAQLSGARFSDADFTLACLSSCDLFGAVLAGAHLVQCDLRGAGLSVADLRDADCREADLRGADLRGARVDAATSFIDIALDTHTMFGDVVWFGAPLTQVEWRQAPTLGDELEIYKYSGADRQKAYRDAVRAYRGLWTTLRRQGIYDAASRYRLREKRLERCALRERGNILGWLSSLRADLVAGYGEQPWKALVSFVVVVGLYSPLYYLVGNVALPFIPDTGKANLSPIHALVLSLELFEGRTQSMGTAMAVLGASETLLGAFILLAFTVLNTRRILGQT